LTVPTGDAYHPRAMSGPYVESALFRMSRRLLILSYVGIWGISAGGVVPTLRIPMAWAILLLGTSILAMRIYYIVRRWQDKSPAGRVAQIVLSGVLLATMVPYGGDALKDAFSR